MSARDKLSHSRVERGIQTREEKRNKFEIEYPKLSESERKKFDELMKAVYEQRGLTSLHKDGMDEAKWEKLPVFLKDKNIKSLKDPNTVKRLFRYISSRVSGLTAKNDTKLENPEWPGQDGAGMTI